MTPEWLDALLREAGLAPATGFATLGGGTFSSVFRVATADGDVIVKVPPDPAGPMMSYEHGITGTEAQYYRLAAGHGVASVPRTLYHGRVDGVEALVLSLCPGQPWPAVADRLADDQRRTLRQRVGHEIAALHGIVGSGFGYPARPLVPTWREAFVDMLSMVLADAVRFGVALPRDPAEIVAIVDRVSPVLDEVTTATLVHFDLWDGNILVDLDHDREQPRLGGLIDAERAFWGDPVAEFVSLKLFGDLEPDEPLQAGYREAGGRFVLDASTRLRLTLYRLYLYLLMWVETVPRNFDPARRRRTVLAPATAMLDALERGDIA